MFPVGGDRKIERAISKHCLTANIAVIQHVSNNLPRCKCQRTALFKVKNQETARPFVQTQLKPNVNKRKQKTTVL